MIEKHDSELNEQQLTQFVGGNSTRHTPILIDQQSWVRKRAFDASQDDGEDQAEKRQHGQLDSEQR